jgi:hypothetical protein
MEKFNEIKALLETAEKDVDAFFTKGNKSAGTRVRNAMQQLKQLAQEVRTQVQELKNADKQA